ncbi:MAG: phosphoribosyltransferase domain-containing protein [Sulfurimonas sp.]|jgi:hypothetical protein
MQNRFISLKTGDLKIDETQGLTALSDLVDFGSRINKKRGFLFVSKVLGKHLPTKPSRMNDTYKKMAQLIPSSDATTLFIGFAETATALGQGVYEAANVENSFYIHSTRFKTSHTVLFSFFEEHCHAPSHIIYAPIDESLQNRLKNVTRIILIDDEVSTGKTANNLIDELKKILPNAHEYYLLTLLNWSKNTYENFEYLSLYQGNFSFEPNNLDIPIDVISEPENPKELDAIIPYNFGRYGTQKLVIDFKYYVDAQMFKGKKVLVVGTAEFMYVPYLFAYYLEKNGVESYFQATTRSPINIDAAIHSKLHFKDNYFEAIDNFLYNVMEEEYDTIFLCYETTSIPEEFDLKHQLSQKFSVEEIFFRGEQCV